MQRSLLVFNIFVYILFALFTLFLALDVEAVRQFNLDISRGMQGFHNHKLDIFFSFLTFLASGEVCVAISIVFSIYSYIYHRDIYLVVWLFLLGVVLELVIKYYLPMPDISLDKRDIFHLGLSVATNYTYPSGHAIRSAFFGIFIAYFAITHWHWERYITITFASIIVFLLLYSRSYLGVHWFVDVIGGALLGVGLALSAILIIQYKSKKYSSD
jgi:undecaprenyl-diphosphatase